MSATDRTDAFEVGIANVNFRVRCETLGHGDEVFLVSDEGQGARKVGFLLLIVRCFFYELFLALKFSLRVLSWFARSVVLLSPLFQVGQ